MAWPHCPEWRQIFLTDTTYKEGQNSRTGREGLIHFREIQALAVCSGHFLLQQLNCFTNTMKLWSTSNTVLSEIFLAIETEYIQSSTYMKPSSLEKVSKLWLGQKQNSQWSFPPLCANPRDVPAGMLFLHILLSQYNPYLSCRDHTRLSGSSPPRPHSLIWAVPKSLWFKAGLQYRYQGKRIMLVSVQHRQPWITINLVKPTASPCNFIINWLSHTVLLPVTCPLLSCHHTIHKALGPSATLLTSPFNKQCLSKNHGKKTKTEMFAIQ